MSPARERSYSYQIRGIPDTRYYAWFEKYWFDEVPVLDVSFSTQSFDFDERTNYGYAKDVLAGAMSFAVTAQAELNARWFMCQPVCEQRWRVYAMLLKRAGFVVFTRDDAVNPNELWFIWPGHLGDAEKQVLPLLTELTRRGIKQRGHK